MAQNTKHLNKGIFIAYCPIFLETGKYESFYLHLINRLDEEINIKLKHIILEKPLGATHTTIAPNEHVEYGIISLEDCNQTQRLEFELNLNNGTTTNQKKISPKKFFKPFEYIDEIKKEGLCYQIFILKKPKESDLKQASKEEIYALREKLMSRKAPTRKKSQSINNSVIDLHWEKLQTTFPGVSKENILYHQLLYFEKALDNAIANQQSEITFIHGLGSGKLKNAIFETLKVHPSVRTYSNDYDARYGYGATKVLLHI
mgnify:CR=1 FL=1